MLPCTFSGDGVMIEPIGRRPIKVEFRDGTEVQFGPDVCVVYSQTCWAESTDREWVVYRGGAPALVLKKGENGEEEEEEEETILCSDRVAYTANRREIRAYALDTEGNSPEGVVLMRMDPPAPKAPRFLGMTCWGPVVLQHTVLAYVPRRMKTEAYLVTAFGSSHRIRDLSPHSVVTLDSETGRSRVRFPDGHHWEEADLTVAVSMEYTKERLVKNNVRPVWLTNERGKASYFVSTAQLDLTSHSTKVWKERMVLPVSDAGLSFLHRFYLRRSFGDEAEPSVEQIRELMVYALDVRDWALTLELLRQLQDRYPLHIATLLS
jgi:hypothetical protein